MSNQENGFQGSVPFIQDKEFQNMSLDQIRHIIKQEEEALKKDYNEIDERKRLIKRFKRLQKAREKVRQEGIDIKKEYKKKKEKKRIKTFEEYFNECIKNKQIPSDTPLYFRKALERAIIEHEEEIVREKSSLEKFANKYVIKDVDELINKFTDENIEQQENYLEKGSGWYFKEVVQFEIHTVEFNPSKGSSYIPLPDWISNKKAIVKIQNKDDKCFVWCVLRYLHPKENHEERITDLKEYGYSLNTKGISFPMKLKDITKFEKLNPELPGLVKSFKPVIYTKTNDSDNVAEVFVNKLAEVTKRKYRGAAHNKCNLMCKKPRILPVILHNLQGYDAHLFIKQLASLPGDLQCIPSTEEKYISFSKYIKVDDFRNTKQVFKKNVNLLTRKGVYPYDYVSSIEKLSETQLPPKEEFYSKLNDEDISDDDYQHAINVWNTFECKTIRDYHNLYLKSDVLLLADVFENFRKTCLKHYNLDPAHYYTSPGLAWDACLKETGQHLQLLHDYDKLMMFEQGIRGGISHISKRYAEANNKYMKDYNPDVESTYIQYLDANNLYGWAMSQQLPTHGFSWMKNIRKEKVMDILDKANHSMSNRGRKGYIFEVDLEYPKELWKSHNDYPLAPEKMIVNGDEKLICHFKPRKNYVVHYRNLRQYLEMGMRLTAVHRGISFNQSSCDGAIYKKKYRITKSSS
ncbi:uncharacterized protein [Porites lutea]|uniref:uncharacterized protein n=1 Tax=Porites lutea TaxID=51062 RepID=UPI003CC614DF